MNYVGWLFVLAAYIAVIGIFLAFKQMFRLIEKKVEKGETVDQIFFQKQMSRFFIRVALIELIPIVLIVAGFIQLDGLVAGEGLNDIILELGLVLIILFFGIINIFRLRSRVVSLANLDSGTKGIVNTLVFIGLGLLTAIPIISIVALSLLSGL